MDYSVMDFFSNLLLLLGEHLSLLVLIKQFWKCWLHNLPLAMELMNVRSSAEMQPTVKIKAARLEPVKSKPQVSSVLFKAEEQTNSEPILKHSASSLWQYRMDYFMRLSAVVEHMYVFYSVLEFWRWRTEPSSIWMATRYSLSEDICLCLEI